MSVLRRLPQLSRRLRPRLVRQTSSSDPPLPARSLPVRSAVLRSQRSCWGWVGPGIANRAPDGKSSMTAIYLADPRRTFGIRRNFGVELEVLLDGWSDVGRN